MRQLSKDLRMWLMPGMHVKRWLLLLFVGLLLMSLGASYVLREIYVTYTFPGYFYYLSLQFLPRYVRGALFLVGSVGIVLVAIWQLSRSLLSVFVPTAREESLVSMIYNERFRRRGPRVVTIGGGTGMSTLLRGMKAYTGNLTAIVTVADDGGSSGVLRRELGIIPPGDVRNCIAALADTEPLMTKLFQYRFSQASGLEGHSFGNLFIAAMAEVTGSMEQGIRETSRVLAVRGQIVPSTLEDVTLWAVDSDGTRIVGESNITKNGAHIDEIYLEPENAHAYPDAITALRNADMIIVGPGSLFTSVLPNLLVKGIREALAASPALKVYVCNVATQHGETDHFGVKEHVATIERYVYPGLFHYVLANSNIAGPLPEAWSSAPVSVNGFASLESSRLVLADVVSEENRYRHDPKKLSAALIRLYYDRGQMEPIEAATPEAAATN